MKSKFPNLFTLTFFPLGHFAVDAPGGALWLLVPAMALAWGLSPAEAGFIITAHQLGAGMGYLPAGILGDRISNRSLLLLISIFWVVLGYLAASVSPVYWIVVPLLVLAAAGDAVWHPIATGTMVQQMPQRKAYALSIHTTGGIMAEVLVPLASGVLLSIMDWRNVLQLSVLPAFLLGIALLLLRQHIPKRPGTRLSRDDITDLLASWRKPLGIGVFSLVIFYNMAFTGLLAMTAMFLQNIHSYSVAASGAIFAGMLLGGALVSPFLGKIADQVSRKKVIMVSLGIAAISSATAAFASSGAIVILGLIIASSALNGVRPVLLALGIEISGQHESTTLGIMYAAMDGLGALGAVLAGLTGTVDLRFAILFAAIFSTMATFIAAMLPIRTKRTLYQ
jgi:MFS family permease